ncbi:phospho-N-acetylmuramoyl-pentapeptide-transferase [Candidatus Oleimmundimicrobium sp.]|uniref:phospho-N-acetylmuramoyl-pentapeptide- transferase n=1 Tax=Candidatus Oleimmundimicrobium sp. TaxID=3060597 RepID=UPI0027174A88|nr:phospho-N-acetylmuramoyl-pentapeptide-transferase [Candidatus Oleimmundimicrobium sp.]MDO8885506.1 phospho-N-acetylmuramoyl-pentapeptide-transferase [Candidatus Oleimmundimicrobium sp.]
MLVHMFSNIFNIERFPTFQVFITIVLSLIVSGLLTPLWIKLSRSKNIGQVIRADGLQGHLVKYGTPTMGGLIILISVLFSTLVVSGWGSLTTVAFFLMISCSLIGFFDDYLKLIKARSLGVKARTKLIWEVVITLIFGLFVVNWVGISTDVSLPLTGVNLPFGCIASVITLGSKTIIIPWLYLVFLYLIIAGTSNTVNLTDGLDGLAAGTITIIMLTYAGIVFRQNHLDLAIFCAAIAGACIGFLWYNSYPADIFMGDTGSLGLGGAIAAMAILTKTELLLILIGGIYVIEGLSVIAQVVCYRRFGKRILKMAPIHHHFEMLGWSETKIMIRFWIITGILAGAGFSLYFMSAMH